MNAGSRNESLDIDELLEKIQDDITQKGLTCDQLSFKDIDTVEAEIQELTLKPFDFGECVHLVSQLRIMSSSPALPPIVGNPLSVFVKKVIRKLSGFLLIPIAEDQKRFNEAVSYAAEDMLRYITEQDYQAEELRRRAKGL